MFLLNVGGLVETVFMEVIEKAAEPQLYAVMADTFGSLIENIVAIDRMEASLSAAKAELIDQARVWSEVTHSTAAGSRDAGWSPTVRARRELTTELAVALRIPERTAAALVDESEALLHQLPATFAALCSGAISRRHARVITDDAAQLPAPASGAFEAAVLPFAHELTVAKLDKKARMIREHTHPESIDDRHITAAGDRYVQLQPAADGMAWLTALLPAVTAYGIYNRITDLAIAQQGPDETRTLGQLRADMMAELLVNGTLVNGNPSVGSRLGGIRARVQVTVPVLSLLSRSEEPATLDGYGPIDLETAKELAGTATSFIRLLTHPETGVVLSVGRNRYAVPADLRVWLQIRDGTCRFPGCSRAAYRCDIDHTNDWQHYGATEHDNLAHLCPAHHHLKHATAWAVEQLRGGVLEWTSPAARTYTTRPETTLTASPR